MKFEDKIKYIPLVMFFCAFFKALFITPSWTETVLLVILGSVAFAYQYFYDENRFKLMHKRLDECDKHLSTLYTANDNLKNQITGVSVGQGFRNTTIFSNK